MSLHHYLDSKTVFSSIIQAIQLCSVDHVNSKLLREVTLNAVHLGSFFSFAQLAHTAKFKIEPKRAAVKVTSLSKFKLT